ncbi:MAG: hypothetical protein NTY64_17280 [Deltaproteobacteria bacterium]|nr:hypothetical protein [Deltaproteobacteria bacterium]
MKEKVERAIRQMKCPEDKGSAELLVEWKVQKGKRVLHSVSCNSWQLADYSGKDCGWLCVERLSKKKGK